MTIPRRQLLVAVAATLAAGFAGCGPKQQTNAPSNDGGGTNTGTSMTATTGNADSGGSGKTFLIGMSQANKG